jgi:short-subunit dehydrogenase
MDVNSKGVIYTAHLAYWAFSQGPTPSPSESPRTNHLLLIGSMASFLPGPDTPLYTASKHSVLGLFRVLKSPTVYAHKLAKQRQEIQNRGYRVHVNILCPYFADTPIIHALEGKRPKLTDLGIQLVTVENVVIAASRLVTDESEDGGGNALVVTTEQIARGQGVGGTYQMKEIRSRL